MTPKVGFYITVTEAIKNSDSLWKVQDFGKKINTFKIPKQLSFGQKKNSRQFCCSFFDISLLAEVLELLQQMGFIIILSFVNSTMFSVRFSAPKTKKIKAMASIPTRSTVNYKIITMAILRFAFEALLRVLPLTALCYPVVLKEPACLLQLFPGSPKYPRQCRCQSSLVSWSKRMKTVRIRTARQSNGKRENGNVGWSVNCQKTSISVPHFPPRTLVHQHMWQEGMEGVEGGFLLKDFSSLFLQEKNTCQRNATSYPG